MMCNHVVVECGPVIIGAGAIGLAIAAELSKRHTDIVVLEAEVGPGHHTSSRNSEVIHSGIYYPHHSLKSMLCLSGKHLLYSYLADRNIPYIKCGKLIVAQDSSAEIDSLENLRQNANLVGVQYQLVTHKSAGIKDLPLKPCEALLVPDTGHMDAHTLMRSLEQDIVNNNGTVAYNSMVTEIEQSGSGWLISVSSSTPFKIRTECIINSAGLFADKIAGMVGIDKYKIYFYKGEYYRTNKMRALKHLVYAVPPADQMSLGIHTRHYMDNSIGFGPNAYPVDNIDYNIDESHKHEFINDINKYFTVDISSSEIYPDYAGIRPKINGGGIKSDFIIEKEQCDGDRTMISLIGIESPGLTCSMSIAQYVADMLA
jgi:L-2-hydroxyglutarate oxidase LhgO